ncbi:hypothetical protein ALON55S_05177 [Alishewanella longhuensis]
MTTPANPFVYEFLGNVNLFHARVKQGQSSIGDLQVPSRNIPIAKSKMVWRMYGHTKLMCLICRNRMRLK